MEMNAGSKTKHMRGYTRSTERGPIDDLVADLVLALGPALLIPRLILYAALAETSENMHTK
jgi:hypothetical protein